MIITLANAKGGSGKTTSAAYLAAAWARRYERETVVLDADVQGSASLWADLAERAGEDLGFRVEPANETSLKRLRRRLDASLDLSGGLWVVDAPPQGATLRTAVAVADFVVVPMMCSPIDLQQAWATVADMPQGKPAAVLAVRCEKHTTVYSAVLAALDEAGTPRFEAEHMVAKRQEIVNAMGHAVGRLHEYAGVLDEIVQVMGVGSCEM